MRSLMRIQIGQFFCSFSYTLLIYQYFSIISIVCNNFSHVSWWVYSTLLSLNKFGCRFQFWTKFCLLRNKSNQNGNSYVTTSNRCRHHNNFRIVIRHFCEITSILSKMCKWAHHLIKLPHGKLKIRVSIMKMPSMTRTGLLI